MPSKQKQLKVTLVRSPISAQPKHKLSVKGLGLKRLHQSVILADTLCNRGMINKAAYLLAVEEV